MPTKTQPVRVSASATRTPLRATLLAGWRRTLLFLLLIGVPAAIIIHLITAYAVDVPYWDDWENAQFFTVSRWGHESLGEMSRLQNECRSLFPNLIFLGLSLFGKWNVVREMYFEVVLVVAICAALFQLLRRTGFSLLVQSFLLFAIGWMLFSLTQQENWFFGTQICYYMVPAALCFALLANVSDRSLGWKTLAGLGLAFLAAYSFSSGVLVCALAFPGFLPANWSAAGGWRPSRRELVWHATYFAGAAAMLIAYFWGYTQPGGHGSLFEMLLHLGAPLNYFFAWLGSPLFPREPVSQAIRMGMVTLALLTVLLAACWRGLVNREEQRRLYPWVMLAAYALGTGALTVLGRSVFGVHQALSSRYISFSSYAYVVILVLGTYLWCFHRQRITAWGRYLVLAVGVGVVGVGGVIFTDAQLATMPWIVNSNQRRKFAMDGLSFMPLMATSQNLDALCGIPEYVQQRGMDLLRRHMLELPVAPASLRDRLQQVTHTTDQTYGALDEPDMDANGRVSIRGWAVDPASKQPADRVLITVTPKDGPTRPLLVVRPHLYRPDAAPADGEYQKTPCAFMELTSFDRLAPGDYLVAGWQVDPSLTAVHQLGWPWTFHWARRGTIARPLDSFVFPALDPRQRDINGLLEEVALRPDGHLGVRGWALNINFNTPAKAVLITCTDTTGVIHVVGSVATGEERKEISNRRHSDALTYCGFKAQADVSKLSPGSYQVAAWSVGDVSADFEETVAQLAGVLPVQIPMK